MRDLVDILSELWRLPPATIHELVTKNGGDIVDLIYTDPQNLALLPGLTPARIAKLQLYLEMQKAVVSAAPRRKTVLDNPEKVYALMQFMGTLEVEHLYVLHLNTRKQLRRMSLVCIGSDDTIYVNNNAIFREAVRYNTNGVIVVHNHPSGEVMPSVQDINITKLMRQSQDILGVVFVDHVIVGRGYYSFRQAMPSIWT